jgi:aryl-alcohol dehydrogenase-like predicted oxidoreductase
MLDACHQLGVSFIAYSPLGRGFLAANFRSAADLPEGDHRRSHPRFQLGAADANAALVATLRQIATDLDATPAQVAIAWVLARSERVLAIPGMKTRAHLIDNIRGSHLQLMPDHLLRMEALAQQVQGERHPPAMMRTLDR